MTNRQPLDFTDPRDNVYAFAKMWGSFAPEPHIATFHGTMFASIGTNRLLPVFGFAGTGVTKVKMLDNGHVLMRGKETGFFTDLETGVPMKTWDNPFTGETVEVYEFFNDTIGAELTLELPKLHVGDNPDAAVHMNFRPGNVEPETIPHILPWEVYGDEVLLEWDYTHSYSNPVTPTLGPKASTGPWINPSEHFTIYTSLAELEDRDLPSAHFRAGFSRLSPWWPWMRMGGSGVEGVLFGRMFSRTTHRGIDDVPRPILDRIMERDPSYLELPDDWNAGQVLSTWEAYARDIPPEV